MFNRNQNHSTQLNLARFILNYDVCAHPDSASISPVQAAYIKDIVAYLTAKGQETGGSLKILDFIYQNIKEMADNMKASGDALRSLNFPVIPDVYDDIYNNVYGLKGFKKAMAEIPFIASAEKQAAVGKFAGTSEIINWRTKLDAKRRSCLPTKSAGVAGGQAAWKVETDKVVATLKTLIPQLKAAGSNYWATQHQRMLDYIVAGIPQINAWVAAVGDQDKKGRALTRLAEDLNLLNTVASTR
ncbi:unnamed protein product [Medioppia subpectinata]|uniref:Uncharacterized protein n=1 Tax=Medioppia subpectinata TaxID=1979941 RepID=A0A7R9KI94_9ACAR|nr:unnamed protein product [Medioppia subpectinata]CAG2103851.1 unnamed protein product [Medioppia subpectinata]